jgi:hypothetical protein
MIDLRVLAKCLQQERSTERQSLMLMSLAGLITSGFWIDEFIETTWLAVASRRGTLLPSLPQLYISSRRERKKSKYMTLFFL